MNDFDIFLMIAISAAVVMYVPWWAIIQKISAYNIERNEKFTQAVRDARDAALATRLEAAIYEKRPGVFWVVGSAPEFHQPYRPLCIVEPNLNIRWTCNLFDRIFKPVFILKEKGSDQCYNFKHSKNTEIKI